MAKAIRAAEINAQKNVKEICVTFGTLKLRKIETKRMREPTREAAAP